MLDFIFIDLEVQMLYVKYFNNLIEQTAESLDLKVARWKNLDYNGLSLDDMESRQSVHIRPSSYMHANKFINN